MASAVASSWKRVAQTVRFEARCVGCGYGVIVPMAPERCPMCGAGAWQYVSRRLTARAVPRIT